MLGTPAPVSSEAEENPRVQKSHVLFLQRLPPNPPTAETDGRMHPSHPITFLGFGAAFEHLFFPVMHLESQLLELCFHGHLWCFSAPLSSGGEFTHYSCWYLVLKYKYDSFIT